MTKAIMLLAFSASVAYAQPDPKKPPDKGTTEQAGTNETLSHGSGDRPWANGVSASEQQAALALFQQGNAQLNDGLFAKAAEQYREALKHWQHPAVYYNLALALMNLDHPIETFESLQKAIQFGPAPLEKDKFEHAKEYLLVIEKTIADVEVSCDKIGAEVLVDGKKVFTAPGKYAGKVKVGKHTFIAQLEGYQARVKAPLIGPGDHFRIELKLFTAEELTRYHRKWESNTWFPYAVMGGGAAVGIVGGVLELAARSKYKKFDEQVAACNMMSSTGNLGCDPATYASLKKTGDTEKTLGYVGYGVAGVAIAAGVGLAWANRRQPYQIHAEELQNEKEDKDDAVSIVPVIAPTMTGAMVMGHF